MSSNLWKQKYLPQLFSTPLLKPTDIIGFIRDYVNKLRYFGYYIFFVKIAIVAKLFIFAKKIHKTLFCNAFSSDSQSPLYFYLNLE